MFGSKKFEGKKKTKRKNKRKEEVKKIKIYLKSINFSCLLFQTHFTCLAHQCKD